MDRKTNIILITGFLGAGKTTFLNFLIQRYADHKIGVIVNDFGEAAVDGDLVKANPDFHQGDQQVLLEIANGSIFCSCLKSAFVDGLLHFTQNRPDFLFIETSGMSDPSSMQRLLLSDQQFVNAYDLFAVYCMVDAVGFLDLVDHFTFIENQILSSDIAVITKREQVAADALQKIRKKIIQLNPQLEIVEDIKSFSLETGHPINSNSRIRNAEFESCQPVFHSATAYEKPKSVFLHQKPLSVGKISRFFNEVNSKVYRLKGFLKDENDIFYIDGSNGNITIKKSSILPEKLGVSVFATEAVRESILISWSNL